MYRVDSTKGFTPADIEDYNNLMRQLIQLLFDIKNLPAYSNNAAAVAGGLSVGSLYRTGNDPDVICRVH